MGNDSEGNQYVGKLRVDPELAMSHRREIMKRYGQLTVDNRGDMDGRHLGLLVRRQNEDRFLLLEALGHQGQPRIVQFPEACEDEPSCAIEERRFAWNWLVEQGALILTNWT